MRTPPPSPPFAAGFVDGLPLAIELAAARLRELSPAALLARLDRRLPLLGEGPADAPSRLRTMRDAIAWSYDLLHPDLQAFFRHVAAFVAGFDLEMADRVAGADARWAAPGAPCSGRCRRSSLDAIGRLVDHSLLQRVDDTGDDPGSPCWSRSASSVSSDCAERGSGSGHGAHTPILYWNGHSATRSDQAPRSRVRTSMRWSGSIPRCASALAWLVESRQGERALHLALALRDLWWTRDRLGEGRDWLDRALVASDDVPSIRRAYALSWAGLLAAVQGDAAAAERLADAGAMASLLGDPSLSVAVHRHAGQVAGYLGDDAAAATFHREAIDRAEANGMPRPMAALCELGSALVRLDRLDEAEQNARPKVSVSPVPPRPRFVEILPPSSRSATPRRRGPPQARFRALRRSTLARRRAQRQLADRGGTRGLGRDCQPRGRRGPAARCGGSLPRPVWAPSFSPPRPVSAGRGRHPGRRGPAGTRRRVGDWRPPFPLAETIAQARAVGAELVGGGPGRLTRREHEVLHLLAAGRTDREIAAALFIALPTASKHVGAILAKLGVPSRAAAVARVYEDRLV